MKLVKLGLASVLAVSLSSSAGYSGTDFQIVGACGFGSPKLTKLGKAHSKKFKEHFEKYQKEHEKLSDDHKEIFQKEKILKDRINKAANSDSKKTSEERLDQYRKEDAYAKSSEANKKNVEELSKNAGEKFNHHHEVEDYNSNLKEENEEKELSGVGWGGGVDVNVKFNVADSVDVGPYVGYKLLSGSYEYSKDNSAKDENKKDDKKDDKDKKDSTSKKEEFSVTSHILAFGGFAAYNINEAFSVKAQLGFGPVWRSIKKNDVAKDIGEGANFGMSFDVSATWKFHKNVGVFAALGMVVPFCGEAKDETPSESKDNKTTTDKSNDKDNKNSSSVKQDHHLSNSYLNVMVGLVISDLI